MKFTTLVPPEALKNDIECIRMIEHSSEQALAIKVFPGGLPGLVFQQNNGRSALENIITSSGRISCPTPLFLYGAGIEPAVMHYKSGSYTTIQVIFRPHALKSLLGINASVLSSGWADLHEFSTENLNAQLLEASSELERLTYLTNFLLVRSRLARSRDSLVEESLRFIHRNIGSIQVTHVLKYLSISERQFERRFTQAVGLSPQLYIRIRRFNEAIRLIQTGKFERLTDVAYALNFYDQAHFIHDIKKFAGITPRSLSQKVADFHEEQTVYSYVHMAKDLR